MIREDDYGLGRDTPARRNRFRPQRATPINARLGAWVVGPAGIEVDVLVLEIGNVSIAVTTIDAE